MPLKETKEDTKMKNTNWKAERKAWNDAKAVREAMTKKPEEMTEEAIQTLWNILPSKGKEQETLDNKVVVFKCSSNDKETFVLTMLAGQILYTTHQDWTMNILPLFKKVS